MAQNAEPQGSQQGAGQTEPKDPAEAADGGETTEEVHEVDEDPKHMRDFRDEPEKSIEFQKIQEEYNRNNPIEFTDKTEFQTRQETAERIKQLKNQQTNEEGGDPMMDEVPEKPAQVVKYPTDEIDQMVAQSQNASCNRRLLFSYLESMTDETFFSNPRSASTFHQNVCPGLDRTCCMDSHLEELVRTYKEGISELNNFQIVLETYLKTIEMLNIEDVERFSKSQELINQNKCVGLSDLSILVQHVEKLKENLNMLRTTVTDYFAFYREYYSGFVCHYCAVDAENFFVMQPRGNNFDKVQMRIKKSSCMQVMAMELRMQVFLKYFNMFLELIKAIQCEARNPDADKITLANAKVFARKEKRIKVCIDPKAMDDLWEGECKGTCRLYHRFTYKVIDATMTNVIVDAILAVKKKFSLSIMAPNDLLAWSFIKNIVPIFRPRKDSDFSLDQNYLLNITNLGMKFTDRPMNLTYVMAGPILRIALWLMGLGLLLM
jgi:hypothetical protein